MGSQDLMTKKKPVDLPAEIREYIYTNWCCCVKFCVDQRAKRKVRRTEKKKTKALAAKISAGEMPEPGNTGGGEHSDTDDDEEAVAAAEQGSQANSLLIEWFDQLKANETEFEMMQTEISSTKKDDGGTRGGVQGNNAGR